jgi:hypothetical protein
MTVVFVWLFFCVFGFLRSLISLSSRASLDCYSDDVIFTSLKTVSFIVALLTNVSFKRYEEAFFLMKRCHRDGVRYLWWGCVQPTQSNPNSDFGL